MIERAQLDADLAQRRFMRVDPNNRLVANTPERDWNDTLRAVAAGTRGTKNKPNARIDSCSTTLSTIGWSG